MTRRLRPGDHHSVSMRKLESGHHVVSESGCSGGQYYQREYVAHKGPEVPRERGGPHAGVAPVAPGSLSGALRGALKND